jgi:hypothetical protein
VATVSTNDVWAVGYTYSIQTLIEHWNGTQWSIVPSPSPGTKDNRLTGVTAISTDDIWAVGYEAGGNSATQTLTEHWDGTQWSVVSSPNHQGSLGSILTAVTSVSTNDVWAVGSYDSCFSCSESLVEHWDGTQWSILSSPNHGLCDKLNGVTAISTNDVWTVGNAARKCNFQNNLKGTALIEKWNGKKWSIASSPKTTGVVVLYGVSAASQNDIWAVGVSEFKHIFSTITEHWNGTQWSVVPSPNPGIQQNTLFSVAVSGSAFWAVGYYFIPQGNVDHTLTELYA